ncbi:MAG: 4Fe-4S binding protein [Candidatus Heimdallarchaeota archaeon]|nr:4Fe-4S binding protein [Candidatus Heimdallarchaeota archaeon]MBY8995793.1 4Fe-4S binding protein [Candidatus Heimdallarchaeota archaeon]
MCDHCLKHGTAGKWYLNAKNYSYEIVEEYNLQEFLMEQYKSFEQIAVRKIAGFNGVGLGYKIQIPIIGRIVKYLAEQVLHSTKPPTNPFKPEGHIGQVVPLDDAIAILEHCAAEPIIQKYCMCRYMHRGEKDACCINFGVMSEIIEKLPRFIPVDEKFQLTREEAIERFKEHNKKGYIGTIWYGPYPYINNLCSCANPECAGIRPRLDFGINSIYKAEYVVDIESDQCTGCKSCISKCQFNAIKFDPIKKQSSVDLTKCFGCGVCLHACKYDAMRIHPRKDFPELKGIY